MPNTVLLRLRVTDSDPSRSTRIARALSSRFVAAVQELETPPDRNTSPVKVEAVAETTPEQVSPRPVRNLLLAGLLGLLLGVAAAMLREMLDVTVKSVEALERVSGAPVLAVVPFEVGVKRAPLAAVSAADAATQVSRAFSASGEAFRYLRTNLQFVDVDHPAEVIVITSAVLEEGKSTTAVNLAVA
ncbi:hypothetical protein ACQEVC_43165 [Plantactinospora sp. CA-294935]|uniref:hypothetical protein n=1 Tax=Plantactinospora sp. CA-294935 TaxID=3240012 RepID=UPI003D93E63C